MKTKDLVPFGIGFVLGFIATRMNWGTKLKPLAKTTVETAKTLVTDVKDVAVDTAKQAKCELSWNESTKMRKFSSQEAFDKAKAEFMATCMIG